MLLELRTIRSRSKCRKIIILASNLKRHTDQRSSSNQRRICSALNIEIIVPFQVNSRTHRRSREYVYAVAGTSAVKGGGIPCPGRVNDDRSRCAMVFLVRPQELLVSPFLKYSWEKHSSWQMIWFDSRKRGYLRFEMDVGIRDALLDIRGMYFTISSDSQTQMCNSPSELSGFSMTFERRSLQIFTPTIAMTWRWRITQPDWEISWAWITLLRSTIYRFLWKCEIIEPPYKFWVKIGAVFTDDRTKYFQEVCSIFRVFFRFYFTIFDLHMADRAMAECFLWIFDKLSTFSENQ